MKSYFIGIDIGTQGARLVVMDVAGNVLEQEGKVFPLDQSSREEQSPQVWWEACLQVLKKITVGLRPEVKLNIKAMTVTSTSGTVIPVDSHHMPLHNALMYSDKRCGNEAVRCREIAEKYHSDGYTGFNTSSGLSSMIWFVEQFPEKVEKIAGWIHAADYITGKLSGCWGVTDYTNAFKSGYDVKNLAWPSYLYEKLPQKKGWLPQVVPSGTVIGTIDSGLARDLNLPSDIQVTVGITDGCASQVASGAINPGDWNTTIGTTMVIKGVTIHDVNDPQGRIYSHRHPTGYWMPGGASNTGADWVTGEFEKDIPALNKAASALIPTGLLSYPLKQKGERFPFVAPDARGFEPPGLSRAQRFAANMEGVAYIERLAFELISNLSGETIKAVYTAGGGSNNDLWLKIRSSVMNLPIYKMKHVSGAVGAAIVAASNTHFSSVIDAAHAMTQIDKEIHPSKALARQYESGYRDFLTILKHREYIKEERYA